jgi:hypothetical protein
MSTEVTTAEWIMSWTRFDWPTRPAHAVFFAGVFRADALGWADLAWDQVER